MKFIDDNKIENVHIINAWLDKLVDNVDNQATIILFTENKIKLSEEMESKLKVIMKKSFLKYANEVTDVKTPMDFLVIINKRKQEIMTKLEFCEIDH